MADVPKLPRKSSAGSDEEVDFKTPEIKNALIETEKESTEETEEESSLGDKVKDKVGEKLKDKVKDKVKELVGIGEEDEGKKELVDRVIARDNDELAKRAATQSNMKSGVGVPTQSVSTVTGQAPPSPASVMEMAGPSAKAVADPGVEKMAARAGRARVATKVDEAAMRVSKSTSGLVNEAMSITKTLAQEVVGGMKNSKNIRAVGLAALMGTAGYLTSKAKDKQAQAKEDFNRQQAIRQQLMKDG